MLTIISILIFTFILFLILLFGKRYYDGIGLTKIEQEKEDETSDDFYHNNDRSSYFSDEVIDCQETIASYDTCVTVGQDLVTILQRPMNGGKQCTDKVCKNTDVYDCRARGKEREVFIQRKTDDKFLNYYVTSCEDNENLSNASDKEDYGCKNKDIYRIENVYRGVKWDISLKWEDYDADLGVSKWKLKILPINAREGDQIKYPGRDSFQISAHIYSSEYYIDKTIYLRQTYENCSLTGSAPNTAPRMGNDGISMDGTIGGGGGTSSPVTTSPIVGEDDTDSSPSCIKIDNPDRKLISDTLGLDHNPYTFLSHPSSYNNDSYIKLICAEDSLQTIQYQTAWSGDSIDTSTPQEYDDKWTWKVKSEQERECENDYKKCISYEEFFPYHGKRYDISFGKCVPKTSFLNKLSTDLEGGSQYFKWSPDLADIVTKKCDQSMYCDEGMESSNIYNANDMTIQYDYLLGKYLGNSPAGEQHQRNRAKSILQNDMGPITYSQVCTIKTE